MQLVEKYFKFSGMSDSKRDIGSRLQEIRKALGLNQEELGARIDKRKASISKYENGDAEPPYSVLQKYVELSGKSFDWIFTGEESKKQEVDKRLTYIEKDQNIDGYNLPQGYARSEVFMLGGAGAPHSLVTQEPVDAIFLPQKFLKPSIVPIKISGRSMEPIIYDGAFVGVDREDRRVVSGEVYAVSLPYEGTVVKRIYISTDHVLLKSDNPVFPELSIPIDKIDPDNFIFGRVKWVLQEF